MSSGDEPGSIILSPSERLAIRSGPLNTVCGALWCSGKASDSRSIGTGFDPH